MPKAKGKEKILKTTRENDQSLMREIQLIAVYSEENMEARRNWVIKKLKNAQQPRISYPVSYF